MIIDKNIECLDPFLPHIHIFIVPNGSDLCDMDSVKNSSVFDKMITVDKNGLICDKAKGFVDFINGVCLSMCIVSNANNDDSGDSNYPSEHHVLGSMSPYYDFIKNNIQVDLSLVDKCHEMLCFMVLPEDSNSEVIH